MADKVAVITGIGSGIAQATSLLFARQGAQVVGGDIDHVAAQATVATGASEGLQIEAVGPVDLRTAEGAQLLVDAAVERYGRIDILVNAAAALRFASMDDIDYHEHWRYTVDGELDTAFLPSKAAWPHMKHGGASIVNFGSVIAWNAVDVTPMVPHAAGKGGVVAMTRAMAAEGAPHGIRVNSISPGFVLTGATASHSQETDWAVYARERAMLKSFGEPMDIAWGALYLASAESKWVTGIDLRIDGGWTAW